MRFSEHFIQRITTCHVLPVISALTVGCASIDELKKGVGQAFPSLISSTSLVPASASAQAAVNVPLEADRQISPEVRRAFESARRALAAGRLKDAEQGFWELTQRHPELGGPHANLGAVYRQTGKLKEAAQELELATRASPRQASYFNLLGVVYREQGNFTQSREAYESAIELAPNDPSPLLNLGILYDLYLGDAPRALEHYVRYLALTPGGDPLVTKWIADLKNRKPPPTEVGEEMQ